MIDVDNQWSVGRMNQGQMRRSHRESPFGPRNSRQRQDFPQTGSLVIFGQTVFPCANTAYLV